MKGSHIDFRSQRKQARTLPLLPLPPTPLITPRPVPVNWSFSSLSTFASQSPICSRSIADPGGDRIRHRWKKHLTHSQRICSVKLSTTARTLNRWIHTSTVFRRLRFASRTALFIFLTIVRFLTFERRRLRNDQGFVHTGPSYVGIYKDVSLAALDFTCSASCGSRPLHEKTSRYRSGTHYDSDGYYDPLLRARSDDWIHDVP